MRIFHSDEIETSEISKRFRVFFQRYLSTKIRWIKIVLQIVDEEKDYPMPGSHRVCFSAVVCRRGERKNNEKNTSKVKFVCFEADESAENSKQMFWAVLPIFNATWTTTVHYIQTQYEDCDTFPTSENNKRLSLPLALKLISSTDILI